MNKLFAIVIGLFVFASCGAESREPELEAKIKQLEKELDECKNSEAKFVGVVRNSFAQKDYHTTIMYFDRLREKFPGSTELIELKALYDQAVSAKQEEARLKNLQREKEEVEKKKQQAIAERKLAAEEAEKRKSLTKLKKRYDDIDHIYWYDQRYFTHYTNSNRISIQMGKRQGQKPWLNLMMSYEGDDWIFFDEAYLAFDGETRQIQFNRYSDKKSDNDGGRVWEWIAVGMDDYDIDFLTNLAKTSSAKMRLSGKYTKTRSITPQERQGITDIINAYYFLLDNPDVD